MPSKMKISQNSGTVMMRQVALRKIYLIRKVSEFVLNVRIHLGVWVSSNEGIKKQNAIWNFYINLLV